MEQPLTTLKIVIFVPNMYPDNQEDNPHQLCLHLLEDHPHQVTYPNLETTSTTVDLPWTSQTAKGHDGHAMPSTNQSVVIFPVTSYMCAKYKAQQLCPGPPFKPTPRTPLRPFVLEHELSNHPNKYFVKQLINDLSNGCSIEYKGPQFSYHATNLLFAYVTGFAKRGLIRAINIY